ncbi:MAG: sulfatase [Planctomycetota bacterium]
MTALRSATALRVLAGVLAATSLSPSQEAAGAEASTAASPPNIVLIFIDDMGYADIGPFGGEIPTPNLDRFAEEGMRFTDFSVPSAVCSASRAALLTGCYHRRVGIAGALGPSSTIGIAETETTLAEICKQKGYATACFGKWHLGHHPKFLPLQHGFDEYLGLPYSNDMWPWHPDYAKHPPGSEERKRGYPELPMIENDRVVDDSVDADDQKLLTKRFTERAVEFIERNAKRSFFLYLAHPMVHVPLFVSKDFEGASGKGAFGDAVMEVDWSVGRILATLDELNLSRDTLVIFTSDNGPWLSYGEHAGSAGPLREGKGTMFEGGIRVPTMMRWPGRVPSGATCDEFASTIDVLPTVARLLDATLPEHRIDGRDISDLMLGVEDAKSPHDVFYSYYAGGELQAVRDPRFKLLFPHGYRTLAGREGGRNGSPVPYSQAKTELVLFDLKADPGETTDVAAAHPEVVARLKAAAALAREDLGDKLTKSPGKGIRGPGRLSETDAKLVW